MEIEKLIFIIKFIIFFDNILLFYDIQVFHKIQNLMSKLLNKMVNHLLTATVTYGNTYCVISGWCCDSFDLITENNQSLKRNLYRKDLHDILGKDFMFCGFEIVKQIDADLRLSLKEKNGNNQKISIVDNLQKHNNLILNKNDINDNYPNCFRHKSRDFSCGYIDNFNIISKNFLTKQIFSLKDLFLIFDYLSAENVQNMICALHRIIDLPSGEETLIRLVLGQPEWKSIFDTKVFHCPICKVKIDLDFNNFFEIELLDIAKETREEIELQKDANNFDFTRINKKFFKVESIGNITSEKFLKTNTCIIRNVQINSPDVLIQGQKLLEHDFSAVPYRGFIAGRYESVIGIQKNLKYCYINKIDKLEVENIDEGFLLTGRSPQNWYHAMIEYIPRILVYENFNNVPLLVSSEINPRAKEVFDIFGLTSKVKYLYPHKSYKVKNLIVPKALSFGLDDPTLDWKSANYLNFKVIQYFYQVLKSMIPKKDYGFDKVYSFRDSSVRSILNFEEIEHILDKQDYSKIDFVEFSLPDQINILRNVSHLIAPAGAIMANFPYLKEGTNVLSLIAKHNQKALIVPTMTSFFGVHHYQYLGTSAFSDILRARTNLDRIHLPYRINKRYFDKSVKEFTNKISKIV